MITSNSNLSPTQNALLLTIIVLLSISILQSFFSIIFSMQKETKRSTIAILIFTTFTICVVIFIMIIFVFKNALNIYPCPIYLSKQNDATSDRSSIQTMIGYFQQFNSQILDYNSNRDYVVISIVYAQKMNITFDNQLSSFSDIRTSLPPIPKQITVIPLAYVDGNGNIETLTGSPIISM